MGHFAVLPLFCASRWQKLKVQGLNLSARKCVLLGPVGRLYITIYNVPPTLLFCVLHRTHKNPLLGRSSINNVFFPRLLFVLLFVLIRVIQRPRRIYYQRSLRRLEPRLARTPKRPGPGPLLSRRWLAARRRAQQTACCPPRRT